MFDTDLDTLDADALLTHMREVQAVAHQADVRLLQAAAAWADLHGVLESTSYALPGVEQIIPLGGDGTPEVSEFCPAEVGAELGISPASAAMLIGDALDLRHRLPQVWARICAGEVKPWIGRRIATDTRGVSLETVTVVDRRVAKYAHGLTWGRLAKVVQAAIIDVDPDYARDREAFQRRNRGVWLNPADDTGTITGSFAAAGPDALRFDAGLDRTADALAQLGDTDTKEVRRSKALGLLANPQQTLDLYANAAVSPVEPVETPPISTSAITGDNAPAAFVRGVAIRVDPRPKAVLYVHTTKESLEQGDGVARVEGIGPVSLDQAKQWLGDCTVTLRPVIDVAGIAPVDSYEIPDQMREAVRIMTPADTFPYGTCTSRKMDIDHTDPFVDMVSTSSTTGGAAVSTNGSTSVSTSSTTGSGGAPPGQTRIGNLGPMTRRHHRIKTHSRWQVRQPLPGIYLWRSPHGRHWLVDHTGTHRLSA